MSQLAKNLSTPDPFIEATGKVWNWFHRYRAILGWSIFLIIAAVVAVLGVRSHFEGKEEQAQSAFYRAEKKYLDQKRSFDEALNAKKDEDKAKSKDNKANSEKNEDKKKEGSDQVVPSGDLQKDYGAIISEYKKVIEDYPKNRAAVLAAIDLGALFREYKQWDEGLLVLSRAEPAAKEDGLLWGLLLMEKGSLMMEKGEFVAAQSIWDQLLGKPTVGYLHPYALLNKGLCFEKSGNKAQAIEQWEKLNQNYHDKPVAKVAKKYLRMLQLADSSGGGSN